MWYGRIWKLIFYNEALRWKSSGLEQLWWMCHCLAKGTLLLLLLLMGATWSAFLLPPVPAWWHLDRLAPLSLCSNPEWSGAVPLLDGEDDTRTRVTQTLTGKMEASSQGAVPSYVPGHDRMYTQVEVHIHNSQEHDGKVTFVVIL